jgi:putative membrane protein
MTPIKDVVLTFLKGTAMGGADIIPGVSGGTIAFITGIYARLIDAIKAFDGKAIQMLFRGQFKAFWTKIDGAFLFTLFTGILLSIFSLARLISYLLTAYSVQVWSFFFGLIIVSSFFVGKEVSRWNLGAVLSLVSGILIAFLITAATPAQTPEAIWFIFLAGAVAISAMILPGISGSFILLIFGKYQTVLNAVKSFDWVIIVTFGLGCVVGILAFSRLISWLLKTYHNLTVALLSGFMIGSLNKVWPWKNVVSYRLNSKGIQVPFIEENVLPIEYLKVTGKEPHIIEAILFAGFGIFIVVFIELLNKRLTALGE